MKLIFIAGIILALCGLSLAASCVEPANPVNCLLLLRRFSYDPAKKECTEVFTGGCPVSQNRFRTKEDCEATCKK